MRLAIWFALAIVAAGTFARADNPLDSDLFAEETKDHPFHVRRLTDAVGDLKNPVRWHRHAGLRVKHIALWSDFTEENQMLIINADKMDLVTIVQFANLKNQNVDLAHVALLSADGMTVRFFNLRGFLKANTTSGITVKRGDFVALLKPARP